MFQQKNNIMAYSRFLSPNMWGYRFSSIPNLGTGFPCQGYELKKSNSLRFHHPKNFEPFKAGKAIFHCLYPPHLLE
jgi:hypothetical protein